MNFKFIEFSIRFIILYEKDSSHHTFRVASSLCSHLLRGSTYHRWGLYNSHLYPRMCSVQICQHMRNLRIWYRISLYLGYQLGENKCEYAEKPVTECCVLTDSDGVCKQCAPGLVLDGNSCFKIQRPGCLEGKGQECLNCADGYRNRNGKCFKKLASCLTYN